MTARELADVVTGLKRLLRLDREAVDCFDPTPEGFWRSFAAAWIAAPAFLVLTLATMPHAANFSLPRYLLVETISYVIGWVAFPLVMVTVTRSIKREERFFPYMTAYNWFHLPASALLAALALLGLIGLLPWPLVGLLGLLVNAANLMYLWFLAQTGLKTDALTATGIVILDVLISLVLLVVTARIA